MNALTFEIYAQLRDLFENLRYDETVHALVLTGAGANFCSGGDVYEIIGELLERDMKGHLEFVGLTGADMGAGYLLPRVVGLGRASELLMLGDTIDATTAERYGLVNRVVAHADLLPSANAWAKRLAQGPTFALSMTKHMINHELSMDLVSALEAEAQAQALMLMGDDHRSFYEAYKVKEKPKFTGR